MPNIGCPIHLSLLDASIRIVTEENDRCCPPDCCDMRGLLTFQILWELRESSLTGQQIAERIEKRRGTRPTAGTIYPALRDMKEKGLIEGREAGREVFYSLTTAGRNGLSDSARYFCRVFGDIIDECRTGSPGRGKCRTC